MELLQKKVTVQLNIHIYSRKAVESRIKFGKDIILCKKLHFFIKYGNSA